MKRERITIMVQVDTDPVPGWGNDPNDYVKHIQGLLNDTIPHYNPVVRFIERSNGNTIFFDDVCNPTNFSDGIKDQKVAPSSS